MSFDALAWAAKQKPGNLAAKMALLALANYAGETGLAYPSTAAIAEFGDMNHKTATAALDRLETLGMISDSGKRVGRSKQIKVYQLHIWSHPKTEASQNGKPPKNDAERPPKTGDGYSQGTSQKKKETREHELPEDWEPVEFGENTQCRKIVDSWPPGEFEAQLEHFRAHHEKSGEKYKNWQAAWKTWVLNSRRFDHGRLGRNDRNAQGGNGRGTVRDAAEEVLAEINARRSGGTGGQAVPTLPSGGHGGTRALPAPYRPVRYEPGREEGMAARGLSGG